jgi:hypothetical protein
MNVPTAKPLLEKIKELEILLRDVIKPELNRIYTEPPSSRGGGDMGFFCREHAYHSFFLCRMLGYDVAIQRGELTFAVDDSIKYTTLNSGADHAWCRVNDVVPVDVSINFEFYQTTCPNIGIVYGLSQSGPYAISYTADADEYERHHLDEATIPRIAYLERTDINIPINDLLEHPHLFLTKPARAGMIELFGTHIFSALTLHLWELAHGRTKRLTTYKDSKSTVRTIGSRYPKATDQITHILSTYIAR